MPLSLKTHHFQRIPGTTTVRLQRITPYIRLCEGEGPPVFLQDGQAWSEGGEAALDRAALPPWFSAQLERLTPAARAAVGWALPDDPPPPAPAPAALSQETRRGPRLGRPRGE